MVETLQAQSAQETLLLEARRVNKSFGGLRALRDVDLDIRRGEIMALVGDNGAGKSTLIKVLSGAMAPDAGEIRIDGRAVTLASPNDATALGIETVHQSLGLVDELDVPQNVFLGRELMRRVLGVPVLDKAEMRRRTVTLLENFAIGLPTLNEPVRRLSGGQRQTIAISRLLLGEPRLLIMDEPMAALGVDEGGKVLALVERLRERGLTTLIISHNLEHVFKLADRIAVMKNGAMVGIVRTSDVSRDRIVRMITFGRS
jgi:ABC-type sugar transport system ATPase subunit